MTAESFADLHRRYDPQLRRHAARMLHGSGADVDDAMQEVWLRAYRALPGLDAGANVGAWLHAITANCCTDALRRAARRAEAPADLDALPGAPSPEDSVAGRQALRDVLADLHGLEERQRTAFVRHVVDGEPHERIAAELKVSRQASRSLVLRARRNLERRRQARAHGLLAGLFPGFAGLKVKAAFFSVSAVVAAGAMFTLEREEYVEPKASPQVPEWKLPKGFGIARHTLTVQEEGVGEPLRVTLSCPRGYLLWQFDGARQDGAELVAPEPARWLGAPHTPVTVTPSRTGRVDVWAYCRPRAKLLREVRRDPALRRIVLRNSRGAAAPLANPPRR